MWERINNFIVMHNLADWSELLSLVITIFGFGITIYSVSRAKKVSEKVSTQVKQIHQDFRKNETISDCASALAVMDEIKRLIRTNSHELLADRYSHLRRLLISMRSSNIVLTDADMTTIQAAITQIASFERQLDKKVEIDVSRTNSLLSKHSDSLQILLGRLRNEIGEGE